MAFAGLPSPANAWPIDPSFCPVPRFSAVFLAHRTTWMVFDYNLQFRIISGRLCVGHGVLTRVPDIEIALEIHVNNMTFNQEETLRAVTCIATGYPSDYTYYPWKHMSLNGKLIREIPGNDRGILMLPVTRTEKSYQDNGIYVCKADNGDIEQSGYGFVTIHAKPIFMPDIEGVNKSIVHGAVGRTVEIQVKVFSVPKYKLVNWYRGINRDLKISPSPKYSLIESSGIVKGEFHNTAVDLDGFILTLKINNLTIDDFNTYTVQIENNFGSPAEYTLNLELSASGSCQDINIALIIVGSSIGGIPLVTVGVIIVIASRKKVIAAVTLTSSLKVQCKQDSQCSSDECCYYHEGPMVASKWRRAVLPFNVMVQGGWCEKYQPQGEYCSSIAKMNGHCGCAPVLKCKWIPDPTLSMLLQPVIHARSMQIGGHLEYQP
ncbi:unnamed protein product [Mytilus coruscus]|uniref:Ig-like domain-containing protein n=1 Tax=Mytilus coruscus TaxID=42192 RepID=A0A6J8ASF2_MYTCO|nr:unnamed protein product [Mytilus coruscus]